MKLASVLIAVIAVNLAYPFTRTINEKIVSQKLPITVVGAGERKLLDSNRSVAIKVEQLIRKDGLSNEKAIVAMLVNMWHESRWNPKDKSGSCVGLFQLHTKYAGRGMTLAQLTNINDHMARLFSLDCYKQWKKWAIKNSSRISCGEMAFRFASDVERCAVQHRAPRRKTADKWWGIYAKK